LLSPPLARTWQVNRIDPSCGRSDSHWSAASA